MQKNRYVLSFRAKHGVTLAELCIVMALLSIITVMVTSFCLITRSYTVRIAADTDVKLSIGNMDDGLRVWISSVDSENYTLSLSDDNKTLIAEGADLNDRWELKLDGNKLVGSMPSGALINFEMPKVTDLSFGLLGNDINRPCFVLCSISYEKLGTSEANNSEQTIIIKRAARVVKAKSDG